MPRSRRSRSGSSSLSALSDPGAGRSGADVKPELEDSPRTSETLPLSDLGSDEEEEGMDVDEPAPGGPGPAGPARPEQGVDLDDGSDLTDEEEDEEEEEEQAEEADNGEDDDEDEDGEEEDDDGQDGELEAGDEADTREQEQEEVDEKDAALRAELLIGGTLRSPRSSASGSLSPAPSTGARKLAPLPRLSMSIGGRDPLLGMDGLDASDVLDALAEEGEANGDEASETLSEPEDEEGDVTMRVEGGTGQEDAEEGEEAVEDEAEDTGAEEADDQSHLAAPTKSHSSHAPPPPPAAVRALLKLELQLAEVRNRLHIERMQQAAAEEEMLLNGSHPALKYLWATLSNRRERLHEVSSRRHKEVLEELRQAREVEKANVWTWWTDRRNSLHWDGFEETWSKRRRLAREKNELEQIRIRKPVPRYNVDGGKHLNFDWSGGATPPSLPRDDAARDLALVDQHRRMLLSSRHASPAYFGQTPQYPLGSQPSAGYYYAAVAGTEQEKAHSKHHSHNHHAQRPPAQQHSNPIPARNATYSYPPQTQAQASLPTSAPMPQRNASGSDASSHPPRREGRTVPTGSSELFEPRSQHPLASQHAIASQPPSAQAPSLPSHPPTHKETYSSGSSSIFGGFWGRDTRVPPERALGSSGSMEARLANGNASRDPASSPVAPGLYQRKSDGKDRDSHALADGRDRESVPARPASAGTAPAVSQTGQASSNGNGHSAHSHSHSHNTGIGMSMGYGYRPTQPPAHSLSHPNSGSGGIAPATQSAQNPADRHPYKTRFPGLAEYLNASAKAIEERGRIAAQANPKAEGETTGAARNGGASAGGGGTAGMGSGGREGIFALPPSQAQSSRPDAQQLAAKRELVSPPNKTLGPPSNGLLGRGGLGRDSMGPRPAYGSLPPAQSISSAAAGPRS